MPNIDPDLPTLFDLDYGGYTDDLPFYENLALRAEGPLLELGAGTGRVSISLVQAGFEVWGIDISKAMLESARSKAEPSIASRLHLHEADMRDFRLGRLFDLIFAGMGSFHELLSTEDQAACLDRVREHLTPGGLFICDLHPLQRDDWEVGESAPLLHDWTRTLPRTAETVVKLRSVSSDAAAQTKHVTNFYDITGRDARVRRVVSEVDLRFTTRYEMEGLIHQAGLEVDQIYGDFDLAPYDDASDYMITVARRPEEAS